MSRSKGFTLVELMVTIAVAAVLVGIALPSFQNLITNNRLNTAATDLADAISFARSEAITRNKTITFCRAGNVDGKACAGNGSWEYWLVMQNASGTADEDNVLRRGKISTHDSTIKVTSDLSSDRINFSTDGLARSGASLLNNAKITICASSGAGELIREVILGAASRISIIKKEGSCS